MNYSKDITKDILIFTIDGDLVISNIKHLYDEVMELVKDDNKFVFVLQNCDMLDSSAIGLMVTCYRPQGKTPHKVRIVGAEENIIETIRTMKLDLVFAFYDNLEDAIASFEND